jgi:hypothetical protein
MTQIVISDLQSHDSHPSTHLRKDAQKELINISIKRSLDARKVSGGIGHTLCGRVSCEKPY